MKAMHAGIAGGLAAAVVMTGVYVAAEASARTLAASFATVETARHASDVEFTTRIQRAPAEYPTVARDSRATNYEKARHELGSHRGQLEAIHRDREGQVGQAHR
jgi:hypothetical protein